MDLHLKITGARFVALALMHGGFPAHFKWKHELASLALMNRQMMYAHTFFVAFTVFLMGLLCLGCTEDLLTSRLGRWLSLGLFVFWFLRLVFQFAVYSPRLWRGKPFETIIHVIFSLFWAYVAVVFGMVFWHHPAALR